MSKDAAELFAAAVCEHLTATIKDVYEAARLEANNVIIVWYYDPAPYAFETRFNLDAIMRIIQPPRAAMAGQPLPVRQFVAAYNHIINAALTAVVEADDLMRAQKE